MAEYLDHTATRYGIAAAAIASAAAGAYANHPDTITALADPGGGHLDALRAVTRLVCADVKAGACVECGHHHDPHHPSTGCGCCTRATTGNATPPPPNEDTPAAAGGGVLATLGAADGACVACDTTSGVETRTEGLAYPTPVCDTCWTNLTDEEGAAA